MTPELIAEIKSKIAAHQAEEAKLWTEFKALESASENGRCPHCGHVLGGDKALKDLRDKWSAEWNCARSLKELLPPEIAAEVGK